MRIYVNFKKLIKIKKKIKKILKSKIAIMQKGAGEGDSTFFLLKSKSGYLLASTVNNDPLIA
jgi:hypothetical protein